MPHIAILPSAVADQIAAGEVVERPASVVKELVENALDAGAGSIEIAVEDGGRAAIRISDDGSGMAPDDARLALERHATSKIRSAQELVGVATFGFRGEALPAICSVSQLDLETATGDGEGLRIRAAGGAVIAVEPAARQRGTTVSVGQLFYNTPARKKFLRGSRSEWRSILDAVTSIALTRRDVRLTLTHDGKRILSLPPVSSMLGRVGGLWGAQYAERFVEVDDVHGATRVSGLAERPADVGIGGRRVHLAINGRAVRDHGLIRAAEAAYRSTIAAGVRPSLFLELTIPADAVDVNVHPAKLEVRLRDRWPIERVVENAVRRALGTFDSAAAVGARIWPATPRPDAFAEVDIEVLHTGGPAPTGLFAARGGPSPDRAQDAHERQALPDETTAPVAAEIAIPPLMQLRRTYLMFEREEGVVLIDQHSAHERILFEKFMRMLEGGEAPAQRLLFPLTLHLGPAEGEAFEANRDLMERLGFEIDEFGGHTLIVHAVPMPHPRFDAERCLRDTLDSLTGDRLASSAPRHERLAATVACKAAIKAGDILSLGEMRALFTALGATTLPAHDVHGRSTIVQLSWDELERRFGRR